MPTHCCPPVLLVIFNRPDLAELSFASIRNAKPARLFVAGDGPRHDRAGEAELCQQARRIVEGVDWHCQVETLFRQENIGCRRGVSEAISWFFEHVDEGIILEDDCVAEPTFYRYCSDLLRHYRDQPRLMSIAGHNHQFGHVRGNGSYFFSEFQHIWGWATWRDSWHLYSPDQATLDRLMRSKVVEQKIGEHAAEIWYEKFLLALDQQIDSWGYLWLMSCWAAGGYAAIPNTNLVSNIGFDDRSAHTTDPSNPAAHQPTRPITFPLKHPDRIATIGEAEKFMLEEVFGIRKPRTLLQRLKDRWRLPKA